MTTTVEEPSGGPDGTAAPADLVHGSFSDAPPWLVDPETMVWREGVDALRNRTQAEVPELTRRTTVPPGLRIVRVTRKLGTAVGLWAVGARRKGGSASKADISRRVRIAAEELGPTYIKLAQIVSSGEGLFPEELVTEFKKCRDAVPPESFAAVRAVVEADFDRPLESIFATFEREPIAAASIAQVHAATLRTGERVVVKVQRPTVAKLVRQDIRIMAWLAPFLVGRIPVAALANPPALVDLFAETISEELDFRLEAQNMLDVAKAFADVGQRGYAVPRPHPELVTPRVLVMERFDGYAFSDVVGMKEGGVDTEGVVRAGMIGFMEGCMIHGIFHGDLHGGNLLVLPDGRVGLLDFGITGRMNEFKRMAFLRMLVGASMNDVRSQVEAFRDLGALPLDVDIDAMIRDLNLDGPPIDPTQLSQEQMLEEMQRAVKGLLEYGARLPKELMLFIKNMMFLDGAIATLAPDLDLFEEIATISMYFAETHGERIAADLGMEEEAWEMDLTGVKASFGVNPDETSSLTYQDLQSRRAQIRERWESGAKRKRRRGFRNRRG